MNNREGRKIQQDPAKGLRCGATKLLQHPSSWKHQYERNELSPSEPGHGTGDIMPGEAVMTAHPRPPADWEAEISRIAESQWNALIRLAAYCDPYEAEDVVQSALIRLLLHPRPGKPTPAFVRTAVRFEALMALRRSRHEQKAIHTTWASGPDTADPLLLRQRMNVRQSIATALRTLPPRRRRIVHAILFRGRSYADTAARLGLSVNTVKSQMRIGRRQLRAPLIGLGIGPRDDFRPGADEGPE